MRNEHLLAHKRKGASELIYEDQKARIPCFDTNKKSGLLSRLLVISNCFKRPVRPHLLLSSPELFSSYPFWLTAFDEFDIRVVDSVLSPCFV